MCALQRFRQNAGELVEYLHDFQSPGGRGRMQANVGEQVLTQVCLHQVNLLALHMSYLESVF